MNSCLNPNEPLAPRHPLPRNGQVDRDTYLLDVCRGKADPPFSPVLAWPATQMWCQDESLLHLKMTKVADRVAGFDWSQPGLEILHKHGVNGLHRLNLLEPDEVEKGWNKLGFEPEIVVAGELLEHLDRAGMVLENCRRMMAPGCQMVITVPNECIFCAKPIARFARVRESGPGSRQLLLVFERPRIGGTQWIHARSCELVSVFPDAKGN